LKKKLSNIVIKKHNSLTDAKTGHLSLGAEKILNILYHLWREKEENFFSIELSHLRKLLNMSSEDYIKRITSYLEELTVQISIRDFEYKGEKLKYHRSAFIKEMNRLESSKHIIHIEISDVIVTALEKRVGFTPLDIDICNKFRTKYGYRIYQIYKRYETLPNTKFNDLSYRSYTIDELNEKFGTEFKTKSEMLRSINRGINEVKKNTDVEILVKWYDDSKKFYLSWNKPLASTEEPYDWRNNKKMFLEHIRKNYINQDFGLFKFGGQECLISVNPSGKIYDKYKIQTFNSSQSNKIWDFFFRKQDLIKCLKES